MTEQAPGIDGSLDPDASEEELGSALDNIVPTYGYHLRRVVGLGGSAGSIAAMQKFFAGMPRDCGMAFVVVMHLSPEHDSLLSDILQRSSSLRVSVASDGQKVEPNDRLADSRALGRSLARPIHPRQRPRHPQSALDLPSF